MAEVSLVFKTTKARIGSIELDASVTEEHSAEVEVTDHPVETGSSISDHARPRSEVLRIEGLVTNSPLPTSADVPATYTRAGQTVTSSSRFYETRAGQAYADLKAMKDSGQLLTVVTALRSYDNMVIQTLNVPRDATSGQALRFSAVLKQIRIVSNKSVNVVQVAKKKKDQGTVTPKPTPAPVDNRTMFKELAQKLGSMLQ